MRALHVWQHAVACRWPGKPQLLGAAAGSFFCSSRSAHRLAPGHSMQLSNLECLLAESGLFVADSGIHFKDCFADSAQDLLPRTTAIRRCGDAAEYRQGCARPLRLQAGNCHDLAWCAPLKAPIVSSCLIPLVVYLSGVRGKVGHYFGDMHSTERRCSRSTQHLHVSVSIVQPCRRCAHLGGSCTKLLEAAPLPAALPGCLHAHSGCMLPLHLDADRCAPPVCLQRILCHDD